MNIDNKDKRNHILKLFAEGVFRVNGSELQDVEPDYDANDGTAIWLSVMDAEQCMTTQYTIENSAFANATCESYKWYVRDINNEIVEFSFYELKVIH
ncbi:hypothetical protein HNW13_017540 [Shewanella sp. BF02_Schw]|uniref:hypothetical protein n=1 Tax=Shewanella sp. BF02_Schw TaxID=394908 RepID=UPI00177BC8A9|nr:hypothetical protein [Shewanella sp. BF02_Schw]MBO1897543.1 hypothetical protein [Shewanella sp. BF02_Schw]